MGELKVNSKVEWKEDGAEENLMLLCELLKGNAIPTKELNLRCEKWFQLLSKTEEGK